MGLEANLLSTLVMVTTIVFTLIVGRSEPFWHAIRYAPLDVLAAAFRNQSYSATCSDEMQCATYCCQSFTDPGIKWRDCDPECASVNGVLGELESSGCLINSARPYYCTAVGRGGKKEDLYPDGSGEEEAKDKGEDDGPEDWDDWDDMSS
jgi:hypothetical protein